MSGQPRAAARTSTAIASGRVTWSRRQIKVTGPAVVCPSTASGQEHNDATKHVVLTAECFRTAVRFRPPPPLRAADVFSLRRQKPRKPLSLRGFLCPVSGLHHPPVTPEKPVVGYPRPSLLCFSGRAKSEVRKGTPRRIKRLRRAAGRDFFQHCPGGSPPVKNISCVVRNLTRKAM